MFNDDAVRELAREMLEVCPPGLDFKVDERALVHPVPDGAYVQVWLWVPKHDG